MVYRSLPSVSTAKGSKQLYLLLSKSQTFQGLHRKSKRNIDLPIKESLRKTTHKYSLIRSAAEDSSYRVKRP